MNCLTQHLTIVWEKGYTIMGIWVNDWSSFIGGVVTTLVVGTLLFVLYDYAVLASRAGARGKHTRRR